MARKLLDGDSGGASPPAEPVIVDRCDLDCLLQVLQDAGYRTIGPTILEGAIVYDEVRSTSDLPVGWTDAQDAGSYRLVQRGDEALFGYAVGPHSWKKYLFPPLLTLWKAKRDGKAIEMVAEEPVVDKLALIGVRACELHAMRIQDRIFLGGGYADPTYARQREQLFIVALNCGTPGGTCFCASMGTGPRLDGGYDLALTEVMSDGHHYFVVSAGSGAGADALAQVPHRPALREEVAAAEDVVTAARSQMGRELETEGIKQLLYGSYEHPRWDDVAARCLSCTNCTMVCPTCFCSSVDDVNDLSGDEALRVRRWDSCFNVDFSYIHGGSVRSSPKSRYRQWMTHKLATWIDQFGTSGCVGCGRCITWCPVGIDITEEMKAIRRTQTVESSEVKEH
ncbi:MAG TPA: 4Fe-4S dicluster domain-containing protein [Chloroflexota bacterium]|nr:4Fe-4S dicluster domain-containing protein [Chloroflexota bacterium]